MRARTCVICACVLSACLFPDLGELNGDAGGGDDAGIGDTSKPDVVTDSGGLERDQLRARHPRVPNQDAARRDDRFHRRRLGRRHERSLSKPIATDAGAFTHLTFDAKLGAGASITIALDGTTVLASGLTPPPTTGHIVQIGFQEYFGTPARIRYDDVACDITP